MFSKRTKQLEESGAITTSEICAEPIAGPSEIPALKEGQVCPAYLSKEGVIYAPAAGGYSFPTVR